MDKKQADRRPAEKPEEHGSGRRVPEAPDGNKGFGKPEGQPIDKPFAGRKDILESDRSDRESGRPVQLDEEDEDDEGELTSGRAERQQPYEADKSKR